MPFRLAKTSGVATVSGGGLAASVGRLAMVDASSTGYESLGVSQPDPVSAQALSGGDVLVADEANRLVAEFSSDGSLVWSYSTADEPSLVEPVWARSLTGGSIRDGGYALVCDQGADRVFIVDNTGQLVWQYGVAGRSGSGVDLLDSPSSAEWLPNGNNSADVIDDGNVAICDAGNHRVIVVRARDYTGSGAQAGFGDGSVVWQYGTPGASGMGVDQLEDPVSVQRLTSGRSSGNMLICDRGASRVIEVRSRDYDPGFTAQSVVWQFSQSGGYTLSSPAGAIGSLGGDGVIWITDAGRVLGVVTGSGTKPTGHAVFARYATGVASFAGSLVAPASVSQVPASDALAGSLVIADPGAQCVATVGAADNLGARLSSVDLGKAGRKRLVSLRCTLVSVPTSAMTVSYSVDGGSPTTLGMFRVPAGVTSGTVTATVAFPPDTIATKVAYYLSFAAGGGAYAPELLSLTTTYEPWNVTSSGKGGGGATGNRKNSNGTASRNGSGPGGGSGSGGGVGGGTAGGSGRGARGGRGSGSTVSNGSTESNGSAAGSGSGNEAAATLPAAVAAAGAADNAVRTVSGYAFEVSGRAGGGEGGGVSLASAGLPVASVAGAVLCVALLLLVGPWVERRRLRLMASWGAETPRPFSAEQTREEPQQWWEAPRRALRRR